MGLLCVLRAQENEKENGANQAFHGHICHPPCLSNEEFFTGIVLRDVLPCLPQGCSLPGSVRGDVQAEAPQ